jgi:HAD superfamily hydrolase (TIGR01459 family)
MTRAIAGLSDLAGRYDVLFSDVWGVIHNGLEAFPEPCAALARWRARHGPVVLISNAARPSPEVIAQLDEMGVPREAWSAIVTSGDVTRELLAARAPARVYPIGPERVAPLYAGLDLTFVPLDQAQFICCTGPVNDDVETPEDYRALLTRAAARRLPMICANPDKVVQRGDRLIYCGGALAALYETLGGATIMAGVLAIGDGVATDARGAHDQGLDLLFIAGGIHAAETIAADGALDVAAAAALLAASGLRARYAMAELAW